LIEKGDALQLAAESGYQDVVDYLKSAA